MSDLMQQIERTPLIPNSMAFWGFGQMGIGIKTPQTMLYIDLCLSDVLLQFSDIWARAYPPPVQPEQITNADYYLISHEHADHLDPLTIAPILRQSPRTRFIAPGWCKAQLLELGVNPANLIIPKALEPMKLPDSDVTLTAIPSAHYAKEYDDEKGYRWLGYLIEANGVTFYHAGDTIIYEDYIATLKRLPTPDVAMLPMNGRDYFRELKEAIGNFHPIEAARLASDLGWDMLIVGHNDLYPFNRLPYSSVIQALETATPRQKYKVLQPAELYYYVK
jgi:L-ascorbate 6-phosphate lactonase